MSFGSGGGAFAFGQNNNQSSGSTFGGFGASNNNNNNSTGFGQSSAFGSNNTTTSSPFGGGGTSTFGNTSGGTFGANNQSSIFGNKPAGTGFGVSTSTGTSLFGSPANNSTTPFGGSTTTAFGGNNATPSTGFGGTSSGGAFGGFGANNNSTANAFGSSQNKPLFGAAGTGTTSAFGQNNSPFGSGSGTALGGAVPPCPGTGEMQFQPFTEKEANGTTVSYQTITFMQPYQKYSLEELRLADYQAGRQFGNAGGGTGAFGQTNFGSTNTGGAFGAGAGTNTNTSGGLFGQTPASGGAFGSNTATTGAFGGGTSGGLFGQNKPAGGLFGQQTSAPSTGGLFGTSNNTASPSAFGGFGNTNNSTTQSTGLFGANNNNTQNKPGGLFGGSTTGNTGTGFSFGNTNNNTTTTNTTGGGLFGSANNNTPSTGGGLFGQNNNQQSNIGGGLFGNNNTNNNNSTQSGGLFGNKTGGAFGNANTTTQPSGGLFGGGNNTTTTGGLFGNNNNQNNQSTPSLFGGGNTNNNQSGGLFGQTQNKPGGLFSTPATNNSGGLFSGGASTNNNQGGGLFGNNNNQNSGGLFNSTSTGGGLFNNNNNQNKPSLFGNTSTNNNQQGTSLFGNSMNGGLFGQSQNNQQQQNSNQQEVKHASLLDPNPYGQSSIWTGLPNPTVDNSKPVFTPLTATKKLEESKMKPLPSLRLNQSRYMTPPKRNGFGFSYSTYGTPNSAASTPGAGPLSGSMYGSRGWSGGSFGRSFNRSASVQNLRSQYSNDADDIWKPNAFASSHRNSSGSIKRLTIDRSIRQDLFSRPPAVPALPAPKPPTNGDNTSPPAQITDGQPEPTRKLSKRVSFEKDVQSTGLNSETGALTRVEDDDSEGSPPRRNGASKDLRTVPEDRESHQVSSQSAKVSSKADPVPGEYWMKPSRQEMAKMPRDQMKSFKNFQVGREGCGFVVFEGTVDLTALDMDNLYENIVEIRIRSVTVYPDQATKPSAGKGLNVPSRITIENSWPRNKGALVNETSGPLFDKHVKRLQKMPGTGFVSYSPKNGTWTFTVPHYTRYGLDYDDDEESMMDQSELSLPPHTIEKSADASVMEVDDQSDSNDEDDTFAFKKSVPGQFGSKSIIPTEQDSDMLSGDVPEHHDDGSEHSEYSEDGSMSEDERSPPMPGALPDVNPFLLSPAKSPTKTIAPGTPGKPLLDLDGDWAEQLQRTISPRKQNRDVLRDAQSKVLLDKTFSPIKPKAAPQVNFRNSIDIMNSLFQPVNSKKSAKAAEPDFEFPYAKRSKTFHSDDEDMTEQDQRWHNSFKPHFTNDGKVVYRTSKNAREGDWKEMRIAGTRQAAVVVGQHEDDENFDLDSALASSEVRITNAVPTIQHEATAFSQFVSHTSHAPTVQMYELAHVLFDKYEDKFTHGLSGPLQRKFMHRIGRDRLAQFLSEHILATIGADNLSSLEQTNPLRAAVLRLTMHDVAGACDLLKNGKNYRLMLLVSQIDGADQSFMEYVKYQIDAWREQKSLSEIDLDIRALYEICAGNVAISQGREGKGVPVEDRAETFNISTQFGLDWVQCFALGFFYGKAERDNDEGIGKIEDAVREYQARCTRGEEPVKPPIDDVMWSLLKYYASDKTTGVKDPVFPAALEGLARPWDHANLFTFYHATQANFSTEVDLDRADALAETLASELSAKSDIASAVYALIHISDADTRKKLIQDLLDRFASKLPGSDTATSDEGIQLWQRLTMDLKVPQSWVFMSKARYAASATNNGGDSISELRYLVAAEAWQQAHECLLKRVAPSFVVDEDFEGLLGMCGLFGDDPAKRVEAWYDGGDVFATFGRLMTGQIGKDDASTIAAFRRRLVAWGRKQAREGKVQLGRLSQHELEEHVAIKEMANALARLAAQGVVVGSTKELLDLPVTQEVRASLTMGMANAVTSKGGAKSRSKGREKAAAVGLGVSTPDNDAMDEDLGEGADVRQPNA